MIALAYLATVVVALVILAVALRHRPAPAPTKPPTTPPARTPALPLSTAEARAVLAAAVQLATAA